MGFNLDEHGKPAFLGRKLQTMQNTFTHPQRDPRARDKDVETYCRISMLS